MAAPVHPYSDYGVALRTLRSARNWLGLALFLCVLAQFVGFSLFWWTQQPYEGNKAQMVDEPTRWDVLGRQVQRWLFEMGSTTQPTIDKMAKTQPFREELAPRTMEGRKLNIRKQWDSSYLMLVPVTQLLGLMGAASQVIIVFLTLLVILVAQAPGVAQVTRCLIWSTLLLFMVLPWQYFGQGFPIPGILYGYDEMLRLIGPHVAPLAAGEHLPRYMQFLVIGRFLVWPLLGMLVLLIAAERFRAGIMLAIGHPLQSLVQGRPLGAAPGKAAAARPAGIAGTEPPRAP